VKLARLRAQVAAKKGAASPEQFCSRITFTPSSCAYWRSTFQVLRSGRAKSQSLLRQFPALPPPPGLNWPGLVLFPRSSGGIVFAMAARVNGSEVGLNPLASFTVPGCTTFLQEQRYCQQCSGKQEENCSTWRYNHAHDTKMATTLRRC
jgi:hypothetical protein